MTRRQERIIQESIHLISEGGIQGFTILRLASRIGVTEPAIYRHFKSKNEILQRILTGYTGFLREVVQRNSLKQATAFEKIQTILAEIVAYFQASPRMISVIYAEEIFHFEPSLFAEVKSQIAESGQALAELVGKGQADGQIRTDIASETLTFILVGSLRNLLIEWKFSEYKMDLVNVSREMWTGIQKMLMVPTLANSMD